MVQLAEPAMYPNVRRLTEEIKAKAANIDLALDLYAKNRHKHKIKITDIRHDLSILQGMVYSWFYVSGRWARSTPINLSHDVNSLAMYWLGVDLIKLRQQAYYKDKEPRS